MVIFFFDSTISHIGFMLLALAINTEQSIDSLLFYIIQYTLTNLNTFLIIIALSYVIKKTLLSVSPTLPLVGAIPALGVGVNNPNNVEGSGEGQHKGENTFKDIKYISELKGHFFSNPLLSLSLTICLFSMAGTPPLIGFFSKQFVLYAAVQSGYFFMAFIAIIVSVVSASYYLKIIKLLHSEGLEQLEYTSPGAGAVAEAGALISSTRSEEAEYILLEKSESIYKNDSFGSVSLLTNYHSYLISILTLTILFFVIKPSIILNSTQLLSLSLFNF